MCLLYLKKNKKTCRLSYLIYIFNHEISESLIRGMEIASRKQSKLKSQEEFSNNLRVVMEIARTCQKFREFGGQVLDALQFKRSTMMTSKRPSKFLIVNIALPLRKQKSATIYSCKPRHLTNDMLPRQEWKLIELNNTFQFINKLL